MSPTTYMYMHTEGNPLAMAVELPLRCRSPNNNQNYNHNALAWPTATSNGPTPSMSRLELAAHALVAAQQRQQAPQAQQQHHQEILVHFRYELQEAFAPLPEAASDILETLRIAQGEGGGRNIMGKQMQRVESRSRLAGAPLAGTSTNPSGGVTSDISLDHIGNKELVPMMFDEDTRNNSLKLPTEVAGVVNRIMASHVQRQE